MPDALSPAQERSIAHSTARLNIWDGAVRSGKTVASLLRWLIYVGTAPRGGHLIVASKTYDTAWRNVFGPLMDPAVTGEAARLVKYTRGAPTAVILGRPIEVVPAHDIKSEARLRGSTAAGAYVDEATLVPEAFWTQLLARLSVPGAKLFATTNPDNPNHWLRRSFLLRESELDLRRFQFTLDDNPFLDPAYVRAIKAEYVGLWYRRMILGEWCMAEGAIYDTWDPDRHVLDELPHITRWLALGVDYGTTNPFAGLLLGVGADRNLYLTREYRYDSKAARRQLTDVEYSAKLREWLADVPIPGSDARGVHPELVAVDPSATSFRVQLMRDGITPFAADNSVIDGIRTVSSLLATHRLYVHRSCTGLINELPGYSWDPDKATKGEDAPIKADDHSLDAARYAIHTSAVLWTPLVRDALVTAA